MNERLIHLKVKVKTLAAESRIIRKEARKTSGMVKWAMNDHRKGIVRRHSRTNLLAYGFLRGLPYEAMESKCKEKPNFEEVSKVMKRFGGDEKEIESWIASAKEYIKSERNKTNRSSDDRQNVEQFRLKRCS